MFGQVYSLAGPYDSTPVVVQHMYLTGFQYFEMGAAAAMAWVLFSILIVLRICSRCSALVRQLTARRQDWRSMVMTWVRRHSKQIVLLVILTVLVVLWLLPIRAISTSCLILYISPSSRWIPEVITCRISGRFSLPSDYTHLAGLL